MNNHAPHASRPSVTRRRFLESAGLAALAALAGPRHAAAADPTGNIVDAHSHIWTRDVASFPLREGVAVESLSPPSFTTEELLALIKPHGVSRVVLIAHHPYYGWDSRYLMAAAAAHPGVFAVVGQIDDRGPNVQAVMRAQLKQRVTGYRITSGIYGKENWLGGPGMAAMWTTAASTRQAICGLINPDELEPFGQMCARYPDTPVVIDHLARIGMTGAVAEAEVAALCSLAKHKHVHVKISAFYALGKKQPPYDDMLPTVCRVLDAYGPERCMWGSDSPYQLSGSNSYGASLAVITDRLPGLSPTDRDWLLRGTANKVFFPYR